MTSPSPSVGVAVLRPDLAALLELDLAAERGGFIARRVLPVVEVALQASTYGKIPLEQLLKTPEAGRASGANYARDGFTFTTASYATREYGVEVPVDRRNAAIYQGLFDAEAVAAQLALDKLLRAAELRVAAAVFNTSVWTGAALTTDVNVPWSSHDDATPVDDIDAARFKVYDGTGLWPNALIISRKTFIHLRSCAQVLDRIASQGAGASVRAGDLTAADLARVFDLEEVIVGGSSTNASGEGLTASPVQIWDSTKAMVARIGRRADASEPCLGKTFHWNGDGSMPDGTVETYYDEARRADIVRVRHDVDESIQYVECGHLLTSVTA